VLRNLLQELVKLLPVDAQQPPLRVGRVAVQDPRRALAEVLIVAAPGVVGVDVLRRGVEETQVGPVPLLREAANEAKEGIALLVGGGDDAVADLGLNGLGQD
jgi:hypothetical protein